MKTKNIIQIVICILVWHMTSVAAYAVTRPACLSDNTTCNSVYDILDMTQYENQVAVSAGIPHKQQLKFKSKFRAPGSLMANLLPPQYELHWITAPADKTFQLPGKYWIAPFYYIFLFRLTPF